jgi:hypothetical protein
VKGSLDYVMREIEDAFREQFNPTDSYPFNYYVWETFADHVIVREFDSDDLAPDEYYLVTYQKTDAGYVFAPVLEWEVVELTYQPQSVPSSPTLPPGGEGSQGAVGEGSQGGQRGRRGARMVETLREGGHVELLEATAGGSRGLRIRGLMQAEVVNGNGRRYPIGVIEAAVAEWRTHLHESAGQGRLKILTGEADHPADKGNKRPQYLETVVKWTNIELNEGRVDVLGDLVLTSKGKDVVTLMEAGVLPGGSIRGYYESKSVKKGDRAIEEVTWCEITGADLVGDPSFENVADLLEAKQRIGNETDKSRGAKEMDPKELEKLIGEHPEWFKGLVEGQVKELGVEQLKALEESIRKQLGLDEKADLGAALREMAEAKRKMDEAKVKADIEAEIAALTKDLPYGELNAAFIEAVKGAGLKAAAEVKPLVESKRKEYDAIMAKARLAGMGWQGTVLGPVIEGETGTPEFARGAHEFYESLVVSGQVHRHDLRKPKTINEEQTAKVLERFDKVYRTQLMRESRMLQEQELATDLNLPYSVSRAILQAVWPELVATSIFDTGVTDQAPTRVYYATYAGESGAHAVITDEHFTADTNVWVALAYKMIEPGTVVVVEVGGDTTTYTEGTDYVVDYANGKIMALSSGLPEADTHVSYHYDAMRLGENTAIQRGKVTLAYATLDIAANRLADQITNEAVVFGRSQLGWDATTRTLESLVMQVRRKIDKNLMYNALSMALSVASNSGGTWTTATDPIIDLIGYIGVSKVKIAHRYYAPTAVLVSDTNSDAIGNWDGFTAAGKRPDTDLNANGYVGRIKGLPVFQSTEMSDGYALVLNRELVAYRIFQPMTLKGPFPSYSSGNLVAAEQWYAEQYDGFACIVAGKGSTVKIV